MGQAQLTEPIDLGFSVADATSPSLQLQRDVLTIRFVDWMDRTVTVTCEDVVGLRWQRAERYIDENDRYDGTYVVTQSCWLEEHARQDMLMAGEREFRHLKLNFNDAGILELLCTTMNVGVEASS